MRVPSHRSLPPSAQDAAMARASRQVLATYVHQQQPLTLRVRDAEREAPIHLPAGAIPLLLDILDAMAAGQGVAIVPEHVELTTIEAAELLNVSRPFLIKLLDAGVMPHRKVGTHRRIRLDDVLTYKERDDRERAAVLDQLVREAQEQDMGYARR